MGAFEAGIPSSTSLTFSWRLPSIAANLTTGYRLTCSPLLEGIPTPEDLMLGPAATTANVTGLYSGVTYNCSIVTVSHEGSSLPTSVEHTTITIGTYVMFILSVSATTYICSSLFPAPTGSPEMFVPEAGQRQVNFSWSPPPVTQRNGVLTNYTLSCSPSPSSLPQSPSQAGPLTVAGFFPDSSYSCSVVATNIQGSGPPAHITFMTLQDCKLKMVLVYIIHTDFST